MKNPRENLLLSGIICIVFGAFFFFGGLISMGSIISVSGIILFIWGMTLRSDLSMTPAQIRDWTPSLETLEEAGKIMYRVDTTLDEPKRTSILCGVCAHLSWVDGPKPEAWSCQNCSQILWEEE